MLIAAQGTSTKRPNQRGVFRTHRRRQDMDRTLYVDDEIGAQNIAWAFDNPKVMLATTIRHYTSPGELAARGGNAGGGRRAPRRRGVPSGTSLYKSTDEGRHMDGDHRQRDCRAMTGRTSVAVAMNTNAQRMFIIGGFGLYRSDDGGATWRQMAADDRAHRNGRATTLTGV